MTEKVVIPEPHLLFVDDEEKTRKYFHEICKENFQVAAVSNVTSAVEYLDVHGHKVCIILTDQRMPNKNGVELLEYARLKFPDAIRILTTAYSNNDETIAAINRGEIHYYIQKPWNVDVLLTTLKHFYEMYLLKKKDREILNEKKLVMRSLAANIAHELRTPLSSIGMCNYSATRMLNQIWEKQKSDAAVITFQGYQQLQEVLERSERAVRSACHIINMMLAIAKNQNIDKARFVNFSIVDSIKVAIENYPLQKGFSEKIHFKSDIDFHVRGEEILFRYVMFNLLKNSIYALQEANKGEITISLSKDSQWNYVVFEDTGKGVEEKDIELIFDEFYTTKPNNTGNGIGLAFCKNVIDSFGGHISCSSEQKKYTRFTILFPKVQSD